MMNRIGFDPRFIKVFAGKHCLCLLLPLPLWLRHCRCSVLPLSSQLRLQRSSSASRSRWLASPSMPSCEWTRALTEGLGVLSWLAAAEAQGKAASLLLTLPHHGQRHQPLAERQQHRKERQRLCPCIMAFRLSVVRCAFHTPLVVAVPQDQEDKEARQEEAEGCVRSTRVARAPARPCPTAALTTAGGVVLQACASSSSCPVKPRPSIQRRRTVRTATSGGRAKLAWCSQLAIRTPPCRNR